MSSSRHRSARYTFWLLVALLSSAHFAVQLGIQIVYIHGRRQPGWLAMLGFPHKQGLQKLQVRCAAHTVLPPHL